MFVDPACGLLIVLFGIVEKSAVKLNYLNANCKPHYDKLVTK